MTIFSDMIHFPSVSANTSFLFADKTFIDHPNICPRILLFLGILPKSDRKCKKEVIFVTQ